MLTEETAVTNVYLLGKTLFIITVFQIRHPKCWHIPRNSNEYAFLQDNYVDVTWDVFLCLPTIDNAIRLEIFNARPFFSVMQTSIQSRSWWSVTKIYCSFERTNALLWCRKRYSHGDLENVHVLALSHHFIIYENLMPNFQVRFGRAAVQHWKNISY